ncbi:MAG: hypothetical protein ACE5G1_05950 [bacterium]
MFGIRCLWRSDGLLGNLHAGEITGKVMSRHRILLFVWSILAATATNPVKAQHCFPDTLHAQALNSGWRLGGGYP